MTTEGWQMLIAMGVYVLLAIAILGCWFCYQYGKSRMMKELVDLRDEYSELRSTFRKSNEANQKLIKTSKQMIVELEERCTEYETLQAKYACLKRLAFGDNEAAEKLFESLDDYSQDVQLSVSLDPTVVPEDEPRSMTPEEIIQEIYEHDKACEYCFLSCPESLMNGGVIGGPNGPIYADCIDKDPADYLAYRNYAAEHNIIVVEPEEHNE